MTANFTVMLVTGVLFALPVLGFVWWRFGGPGTLAPEKKGQPHGYRKT